MDLEVIILSEVLKVLVAQLCVTLCDPMDCNPPGSSGHRILQARILEWVAIPFSGVIFLTQGTNLDLLLCRQNFYCLSHQGKIKSFICLICGILGGKKRDTNELTKQKEISSLRE